MAKDKTQGEKSSFDPEIKKGLIIALAIVLLFSSGNFLGSLMSAEKAISAATSAATTKAAAPAPSQTPTPAPAQSTTAAPAASESTPAAPADSTTAAPAGSKTDNSTPAGAPSSPAEIIKLYNESANKIKTNASKVTRNFEDLQHNSEYTEMPGALQSIGTGLISQFLKKNETPVDYTGADIQANFPVKGESYVSKITEADIASATCNDDGTNYNITLKFNECTDPEGTGCAAAFNIIKPDEVYSAAKVVKNFSCRYYDAVIECKIDKASGNITWIKFTLPMVLSVTAQVVVSLDAKVGMTFVDDYSITY